MTSGQSPKAALDQIVRKARYLLISFDGPIRSANPGNPPAPNILDVLTACRESGRSAAFVSERPASEVRAYLNAHDLSANVAVIAASADLAIRTLEAAPTDCVVVTVSPSGIKAAKAIGASSIAYAKTPDDAVGLAQAEASAFVYSMIDLALSLRTRAAD